MDATLKPAKTELRNGMRIDWDAPIPMDDGLVLRADVYRPVEQGQYAVILSYGPYAKGLAFQEGYPLQWQRMAEQHPDVRAGSTNKYQNWEVVDPEKWVPHGYACVRVDSRGAGNSPGYLDCWSPRETKDLYHCIEWAGTQPWSNGKVGLSGISYYAMNAWQVAALQPPHLAAICPWEGASDWYREVHRHGGILCDFAANWYPRQVISVQQGRGNRAPKSPIHGEPVAGPLYLADEELDRNRADLAADVLAHPLDDEYYRGRTPDFSKITVPLLSAANWGGQGLHPRGNFEGFSRSSSAQNWLEVHGLEHWTHFYTNYGRDLQKRFFDHFLKGLDNGWDKQPRVQLQVRRASRGRMAAGQHAVDKAPPRRGRPSPELATHRGGRHDRVRRARRRCHVHDVAADARDRGDRSGRRETLRLVLDVRRRPLPGAAAVRPRGRGDHLPGSAGPAHPSRPGLAASLAPQAGSAPEREVPPLPPARRDPTARAGRGLRAGCRDLADLRRGPGRLPDWAHRPRQGLRVHRQGSHSTGGPLSGSRVWAVHTHQPA